MTIIPNRNQKKLPPDLMANALFNKQKVIELVKEIVANYYGIPMEFFENKSRKRDITTPRHMAMYIIKKHAGTSITLSEIGKQFGNRDHATVLHAANKTADLASVDWTLRKQVEEIELILKSRQEDADFGDNLSKGVYYLNLSNITVLQISKKSSITFSGISAKFIEDIQKQFFKSSETSIREFKDTGLFILEKEKHNTNDNGNTHTSVQQ